MQIGSVVFHAAVTDAVGTIVRQVSEAPPKYLVKLLFSFAVWTKWKCPRIGSSRSKRFRGEVGASPDTPGGFAC